MNTNGMTPDAPEKRATGPDSTPLAWTSERPTEPGYYWLNDGDGPPEVVRYLAWFGESRPGVWGCAWSDYEPTGAFSTGTLWAGPIDPPPAPSP